MVPVLKALTMNAIYKKITPALFAITICLFGLSQIRAENVNLDYYVGDWRSSGTLEYDGQQIKFTGTSSVRKIGADYYTVAESKIAGQGSATTVGWLYANGTMSGEVRQNGTILGLVSGTWYFSGDSIYTNIRQEGVNFDFTQNTKSTFIDANRMIAISDTSYGARIIGESSRILPPAPKITSNLSTVSLKLGKLMTRYTVTTNFGAKSFAAKGLPAGLQLNATTGVVSGKPTKKGTYTVTFTAAKKQGSKVIQSKTAKKVFKVN
jgi:hypothetical protein